jgi:hypothetical protein
VKMPNYHFTRLRFVGTREQIDSLISTVTSHKADRQSKEAIGQGTGEKDKSSSKRVKVDVTELVWEDLVLGLDHVDIAETKPTKLSADGDRIDFYVVSAWSSPASNIKAIIQHFPILSIEQCDVNEDARGQGVNIQKFVEGKAVSRKRISPKDPLFEIEVRDLLGITKEEYDEKYGQEEEAEGDPQDERERQDLLRRLSGGRTF